MTGERHKVGGSLPDPTVRERAINAFVELVNERGLAHTSVDDIAERAGISKTTLYTRWPDRRALVIDGFRYMTNGLPGGDVELSFTEMFAILIERTTAEGSHPQFFRLFAEAIAAGQVDDDIRAVVQDNHRAWMAVIHHLIETGQSSGHIPPDRDVDLAAEIVMAVVTVRHLIGVRPIDGELRELVWQLLTSPNPY